MRISLLLELAADSLPDRIAVDGVGGAMNYRQLLAASRNLAVHITTLGIRTVGFVGVNSPMFPVAMFAASMAGCPFAPLNYRLPDEPLRDLIGRLGAALLIVDDEMLARVGAPTDAVLMPRSQALQAMQVPAQAVWVGDEDSSDIAVLLFTSGTSGAPKAALLKHANLTSYVLQTMEFLGAEEGDAGLVSVPPYHIAAVSAVLTSVYCGRRMVQLDSFTPEKWIAAARDHAVTHAMLVPTMVGRVLDILQADSSGLPHLQALAYGGGRMPDAVIRRALGLLPHVAFTNAYGLTETSSTISILGPEDHRRAMAGDIAALRRLASVGKPVPGISVEIRAPDGTAVAAGEVGEIWVRGEQVSGEYVGRKANDDDGWFPTRDQGFFDANGYLYVDGRLDDVIVRGGENISPGEIEDTLRLHGAVADAAVVGAPDEEWGEKIVAFVVPREGHEADAAALADWVRGRLRSTKTPQHFQFRTELPYNETGKLLRRVLRDELPGRQMAAGLVRRP